MKGSEKEQKIDYIQLFYYKCHKINQNCGVSYVDSPDWIKNKKKTINPIKKKKITNISIRFSSHDRL